MINILRGLINFCGVLKMSDDDYGEDYCEDSQYQTHYVCNSCGYEFWSDSIEEQCWECGSEDIEEVQ